MQIFATHDCPIKCAEFLDDKRVVKMCLETAQILQAAAAKHGISTSMKKTHLNHPCVVWTAKSQGNYQWLLEHWGALLSEYAKRYKKQHKTSELFYEIIDNKKGIPEGFRTSFINQAKNTKLNVDYTNIPNVNYAYKLYLSYRWSHDKYKPTWK